MSPSEGIKILPVCSLKPNHIKPRRVITKNRKLSDKSLLAISKLSIVECLFVKYNLIKNDFGVDKVGSSKGFTIIEILVVIVILGILGTLLVPRFLDKPDEARVTKAQLDIKAIESSLKMYKLENGVYPTTDQGLEALVTKPETEPVPKNYKKGGYMEKKSIKDPWENDYIYRSPGEDDRDYEIISYGADGKEGGEDFNADINSFE